MEKVGYYPDLITFFKDNRALSKSAFLEKFPHPFLLLIYGQINNSDLRENTAVVPKGKRPTFHTPFPGKAAQIALKNPLVAPVTKSDRNAFRDKITVGRAANNDIVIYHPSVSKFHAYFRALEDNICFADAGSSYGTRLDGVTLRTNTEVSLKDTCGIVFAKSIATNYFTNLMLYQYMDLNLKTLDL